jgi:ergothioneine biosynthesis protein EgtB
MSGHLVARYSQTRRVTESLCEPLTVEDLVVQSMPDASPARWHLAHTTWFFETFVLSRWKSDYQPVCADYQVLFNSYYNGVGEQFPRARRGLLTRPTVAEVIQYRRTIDERVVQLLPGLGEADAEEAARIVELGINHEQQHQELLLTDVKHMFSCNPLLPAYRTAPAGSAGRNLPPSGWCAHSGGLVQIGHRGPTFAFDNERPLHTVFLQPFETQRRLVTAGEYLQFMNERGYSRPELWLSLGWSIKCEQKWSSPLYWVQRDGDWWQFTLDGLRPVRLDEPVCHVSYFEADAFARWSGARLLTEAEWEHVAIGTNFKGHFLESQRLHPGPAGDDSDGMLQMYGEVWQWTASPYTPYPGYVAPSGALGEYNGKFMCNQYVLRGGSCVTPASHIRITYRNFFPPDARWQFTGCRLARDSAR